MSQNRIPSVVRDLALAGEGHRRIDWAAAHMPLLNRLAEEFERERPLAGRKVSVSVHLEAKTAYLALVLARAGAEVAVTGSNPLSTQDAVAAALVERGLSVYAWHGATPDEYDHHLDLALSFGPDLIVDDGGDLVHLLHTSRRDLAAGVRGGNEETTTGIIRLRAREKAGELLFPMMAVNDARCKHLFDNRYGTGQSAWDGIIRTTNLVVAGKVAVVAGYGWVGRGVARRAAGLGARVVVTEVDPVKALEAAMDGYQVLPMAEAARVGDIFVTTTGCRDILRGEHFEVMKDGALLANAGHFDVEINKPELRALCAAPPRVVRENIEEYRLRDGRRLYLLGEGRLVNLACADGHPIEIMDLSFAIQALCLIYLDSHRNELEPKVYPVPDEIDLRVARLALDGLGIRIDELTAGQKEYLAAWEGA
ncbi:MAG TPA: adenosylhomocysteinase [Firmicutes bacterium]|nr:adenosylhomocysteinase [Bacillota bacterium]